MINIFRRKGLYSYSLYHAVRRRPTIISSIFNNISQNSEDTRGTSVIFTSYSSFSKAEYLTPIKTSDKNYIRNFSSQKSGNNTSGQSGGDKNEPPEEPQTSLPASVVVPEVWPQVPLIAITRTPVFTLFINLIEVCHSLLSVSLNIIIL